MPQTSVLCKNLFTPGKKPEIVILNTTKMSYYGGKLLIRQTGHPIKPSSLQFGSSIFVFIDGFVIEHKPSKYCDDAN